jgi:hypothetical protein
VSQAGSLGVIATSDILLSVDDANPEMELNRSDCLSVPAGAGAIVCDDFQFVYPFTPVSRMNQSGQIGLVHNSSLRAPFGVIGANFVLPPGATEPDSIKATLVVNGVTIQTQSYGSTLYAPGEKTRLAFDWVQGNYALENLLKYDVTIQPWSGGSPGSSITESGKFLSLDHRARYGRGWWIAGLEKLSVHGDTLIWTGADASGGVYIKSSAKWIRQTRSVPDTIVQDGSTYVRRPVGGGEVRFTSSGVHEKTIDRNDNETRFNYVDTVGWQRLSSVELPTPSGTDTIYTLHYNATSGVLDSVRVRSGGGGWSAYRIYGQDVAGGHGLHIDSIKAPDGLTTRLSASYGELNTISGPRGDTTAITYGAFKVATVTVKAGDATTPDVVLDYQAASRIGRGASGWTAPKPIDSVSARIDGPLSGAADTTRIFTTGWGAVRGIRDATGKRDLDRPTGSKLPRPSDAGALSQRVGGDDGVQLRGSAGHDHRSLDGRGDDLPMEQRVGGADAGHESGGPRDGVYVRRQRERADANRRRRQGLAALQRGQARRRGGGSVRLGDDVRLRLERQPQHGVAARLRVDALHARLPRLSDVRHAADRHDGGLGHDGSDVRRDGT